MKIKLIIAVTLGLLFASGCKNRQSSSDEKGRRGADGLEVGFEWVKRVNTKFTEIASKSESLTVTATNVAFAEPGSTASLNAMQGLQDQISTISDEISKVLGQFQSILDDGVVYNSSSGVIVVPENDGTSRFGRPITGIRTVMEMVQSLRQDVTSRLLPATLGLSQTNSAGKREAFINVQNLVRGIATSVANIQAALLTWPTQNESYQNPNQPDTGGIAAPGSCRFRAGTKFVGKTWWNTTDEIYIRAASTQCGSEPWTVVADFMNPTETIMMTCSKQAQYHICSAKPVRDNPGLVFYQIRMTDVLNMLEFHISLSTPWLVHERVGSPGTPIPTPGNNGPGRVHASYSCSECQELSVDIGGSAVGRPTAVYVKGCYSVQETFSDGTVQTLEPQACTAPTTTAMWQDLCRSARNSDARCSNGH